jgi:hypothetical protein
MVSDAVSHELQLFVDFSAILRGNCWKSAEDSNILDVSCKHWNTHHLDPNDRDTFWVDQHSEFHLAS